MPENSLPVPPDDEREDVRRWRYLVRESLEIGGETPTDDSTGAVGTPGQLEPYPLLTWPHTSHLGALGRAWCLESTTPCLLWTAPASNRIVVCERSGVRWVVKRLSSSTLSGPYVISLTGATACCYVPSSVGGTHSGKFWVGNNANDTITTVDPHNGYATSSFTLGASEANIYWMTYDSINNKVWATTGGQTRVCRIHPGTGSNEAQVGGFAGSVWTLAPTSNRVWVAVNAGSSIYYLNLTTLAITDPAIPNIAAGYCHGVTYLPEVGKVWAQEGNSHATGRCHLIDDPAATSDGYLDGLVNNGVECGWISEEGMVVIGGVDNWVAVNIYSGAARQLRPIGAAASGINLVHPRYNSTYNEFMAISSNYGGRAGWWIFPAS